MSGGAERLYQELAELGKAEARRLGLPAFRIFTNSVLEDLVRYRPTTESEALGLKGIGPHKVRTVLPAFLACIAAHMEAETGQLAP